MTTENEQNWNIKKIALVGGAAVLAIGLLVAGIAYVMHEISYNLFYDKYYKIHMKYPKDWKVFNDYQGTIVTFASQPDNELDNFTENLNISVSDLPPEITTLEQFSKVATGQMQALFKSHIEVIESKEIVLAGLPAYSYEVVTKQPPIMHLKFVWFFKDNKAYILTYAIQSFQFKKYVGTFNDMLRSFTIGEAQ